MTRNRLEEIRSAILKKYAEVAVSPKPEFPYPTGKDGLSQLGYDSSFIESLPPAVAESFCGVGNPFLAGAIKAGEVVLDIGCGAGVDLLYAAKLVGPSGMVYGVDVSHAMLERASQNVQDIGVSNVFLKEAPAESLPFPDETFDVVTSNGVLNLSPQKRECFAEIHRVLKISGRLHLADVILEDDSEPGISSDIESWSI